MMKTRKYIAVIFAAMVMGISGCNDDLFLEEHPDTFYTAEDAFKTVDQVKACVTNMYAHARYWLQNDVFLKGAGTDMFDTPMWRSSGNGMSNFSSWSTDKNKVKNIYEAHGIVHQHRYFKERLSVFVYSAGSGADSGRRFGTA